MKVKVIRRFIDKETKKIREVGCVFDCTAARFKELSAHDVKYVEKVKTEKKAEDEV